jgi:hypothetical protein
MGAPLQHETVLEGARCTVEVHYRANMTIDTSHYNFS